MNDQAAAHHDGRAGRPQGRGGPAHRAGLARAPGVIGLHVVDDNFLQPDLAGSGITWSVASCRSSDLRRAISYRDCGPAPRGVRAASSAFRRARRGIEAVLHNERRPSGDDFTGFLSLAAGLPVARHRLLDPLEDEAAGRQPACRYRGRRLLLAVGVVARRVGRSRPRSPSRTSSRTRRGGGPDPKLGTAYEDVTFTTPTASAPGLVRPIEERRDRDRLPRPVGPAEAGADARSATATASSSSTVAAKARARATRTPSAGKESETSCRRCVPRRAPTSTPTGSAASASRSAARC